MQVPPARRWRSQRVCFLLGEIPCRCRARWLWLFSLREHQSRLSALADRFLFRERPRPSRPPVFFLPGTCEEKTAGQRFSAPGWERAHAGSDPACLAFATQRGVSRPFFPTWPASLCKRERSGLVRGKWRWAGRWQHVTGSFRCWGAVGLSDWPRPLRFARAQRRQSRDGCRTFPCPLKAVEELGLEWSPPESPLAAVWMSGFCRGAVRPLSNDHRRSSLKFTTSSRDLGAPLTLPASVLPLHPPSLQLTALKKRDMRGCLNWMSQWLHISAHPLPSAGRRKPITRPSHAGPLQRSLDAPTLQLGQAASALHSMAVLQVYQAKLLSAIDESEPDPATLRELRSATDLALRATKTTAQAIGRSMASLVVLERHLWLTLTEIKDADRVSFLDAPISPAASLDLRWKDSLSASQRHRRRHRLCDTSCPSAPAQQLLRVAPELRRLSSPRNLHLRFPPLSLLGTQQPRGRSRSARRHPPPKRQGPRPKIALDPAPPASSWSAGQEEESGRVRTAGPPTKRPLMRKPLCTPFSSGCRGIVFVATGSVQAPLQPSAVIVEKIKHKHSQKKSNFPLPSLTSAPASVQPATRVYPTPCHAGRGLAGHPQSVRVGYGDNKRGYSLQFARRPRVSAAWSPPRCNGENARVLRSEWWRCWKRSLEMVPPALSESGFYSRYFLIPKKDGGLRPILDLRRLNHALMRRPFRMITLKQILSQIRTGDWFCSLDLKDAYIHIQIAPHHRRFLRFAFEGVAYQYTVLPFGLSLAPRTFTKCMDAALSPLRQMGIRILNYLDDWLILAQSEVELLSYRTLILSHLERLGLRVNFAKSEYRVDIVPGYSSELSSHESGDSARTRSGHSETQGHLQERHRSPTQSVSENAGPHGRSIASVTAGPAPHAFTLVETTGSTQRMASWTPAYQGESGLCNSPDPLEEPTVDGEGRGHGVGPHQEVVTTDASNTVGGRCAKANRPSAIGRRRRRASTSTAWKC